MHKIQYTIYANYEIYAYNKPETELQPTCLTSFKTEQIQVLKEFSFQNRLGILCCCKFLVNISEMNNYGRGNNLSGRLVILPKRQALHTKMSRGRIERVRKAVRPPVLETHQVNRNQIITYRQINIHRY